MTIRHRITITCDAAGCPEWVVATCEMHENGPARIRDADGWAAGSYSLCPAHREARRKKSSAEADARIAAILDSAYEKRAVKP